MWNQKIQPEMSLTVFFVVINFHKPSPISLTELWITINFLREAYIIILSQRPWSLTQKNGTHNCVLNPPLSNFQIHFMAICLLFTCTWPSTWHQAASLLYLLCFFIRQLACHLRAFRLHLSKHFSNRFAPALKPWSYHISIDSHLDNIQLFICKFKVTWILFQNSFIDLILVPFRSIYPWLQNLAVLNCRLSTFGEGNDVIILVAETAVTVPKPSEDDVAGTVLSPTFWMTTCNNICLLPAQISRLLVEEPSPFLIACPLFRGRGRIHHKPNLMFNSPCLCLP